ncbi:hypothetical protein [Streptomyces antimycoticus]|uniref:hypothetical protein n=1 Tax=Streptomyces antimycoticus TaxID=68175 RepID=UPI001386E93B|nr:hypothetical protein [Streptomyces antimycoticus]
MAPEKARQWAAGLLSAPCPATGSGVPGDNGGVPGGVVIEMAWSCHVDALGLSPLIEKAGLTQVVAEFGGTTVDASAATPLVDVHGAHALPSFPWLTFVLVTAGGAVLLLAARRLPLLLRGLRRIRRRWQRRQRESSHCPSSRPTRPSPRPSGTAPGRCRCRRPRRSTGSCTRWPTGAGCWAVRGSAAGARCGRLARSCRRR